MDEREEGIVRGLRDLDSQPGDLADRVWYRLEDREFLRREDVQAGLAAWRDGDVVEEAS